MKAKKNKVWLCLFLLLSAPCWSQTLYFNYVEHNPEKVENVPLELKIDSLLLYLRAQYPKFPYTDVKSGKTDYFTSPDDVNENTIGTLKPTVYSRIQRKLTNKLKPIFIVKKQGQSIPYYNSFIIAKKGQKIDSLSSPKIKRLYYPHENSTSGYIAPLHKLWKLNVISNPSLKSIEEDLGWEIRSTRNNDQTLVDRVSSSSEVAIGFTGELPPDNSNCEVIFRFSLLPQDVLFISNDLIPYEIDIKKYLLERLLRTGVLAKSAAQITDLVEFKEEHKIAYQDLSKMIERIDNTAVESSWFLKFGGFKSELTF